VLIESNPAESAEETTAEGEYVPAEVAA